MQAYNAFCDTNQFPSPPPEICPPRLALGPLSPRSEASEAGRKAMAKCYLFYLIAWM